MFDLAHLPPSFESDELVAAKFRSEGINHATVSFSDSLENNVSSPADMGSLLERLDRGEVVSPAASESMVDLLKECQDRQKIARHLKPGVAVAHKGGSSGRIKADAGVGYLPSDPLVIAVFAKDVTAEPYAQDASVEVARVAVGAVSPESGVSG